MKKNTMKYRIVSLALSLSLVISIFSATTPTANAQVVYEDQYGTQAAPVGVIVFVAGILAGYVIDGVFIYKTGYSGGELTSMAIQKIVNHAKNRSGGTTIYVDKDGNLWSGGSGKFSLGSTN